MEYKITSGVTREDIKDFFLSEAVSWDQDKVFYGQGWKVEVKDQNFNIMGSIQIPQTDIVFTLDSEDCFIIVDKFRLRFLSAGG